MLQQKYIKYGINVYFTLQLKYYSVLFFTYKTTTFVLSMLKKQKMRKPRQIKILFYLLFLFASSTLFSQDKIISSGDSWEYYDEGYLDKNWVKRSLNNHTWKSGITPIGYGDKKTTTKINFGKKPKDKDITKYFKKTFTLEDPIKYIAYELKIQRDDGIVLYLNGKEIYRNNMPKGKINGSTEAMHSIQSTAESVFHSKIIDSKEFTKGKNIFSVSIHQASPTSSDCIFNLELLGHNNPRVLSVLIEEKELTNYKLETQIKNLDYEFQIKNNIIQLELLKSNNENLKLSLFLLVFLLIITFVGSYLMVLKYRKNEENIRAKILNINKEVFNKDREMMTISTQLLHNKQYFKEIKSELKWINSENKSSINNLIQQIDFVIEKDDEWDQLKKHFETVYSGFYDTLINLHPTLTEIELRHCMFIKLHMQTKEIARVLNIDPRSVQASRYRIKKKMNLDEETDLRNYIISVA